jgi:hypothetical protein
MSMAGIVCREGRVKTATRFRVFVFLRRFIRWGLFWWNHRQHYMRRSIWAKVQCNVASEYGGRAIVGVIVHERAAAAHNVLHVRQRCSRTVVFVIFPADCERDPIAARHHDARGPDFDVQFYNLTRREQLDLVVGVIWAVRRAV